MLQTHVVVVSCHGASTELQPCMCFQVFDGQLHGRAVDAINKVPVEIFNICSVVLYFNGAHYSALLLDHGAMGQCSVQTWLQGCMQDMRYCGDNKRWLLPPTE